MQFFKLFYILFLLIAACAKDPAVESPNITDSGDAKQNISFSGAGALRIAPVVFAEGLPVSDAVRNECQLLTKLPGFVQSYAQDQYAAIELDAKQSSSADYLQIEIVDLPKFSKNAWIGRGGQWVGVKGSLIKKGGKTFSFTGNRSSMGGFMGAYKGTCALLGRCTKALGKDIADWLLNPVDGATLGDM